MSETQIKSNLLTIYYVQNDLEKAFPLLSELLDLLQDEDNDSGLSPKDEYRIYTLLVALESRSMLEFDAEETDFLKQLLADICDDVLSDAASLKNYAREAAAFALNAIVYLLQNEIASQEEQTLYLEALAHMESATQTFEFDTLQRMLLYYIETLLIWNLDIPNVEHYFQKAIENLDEHDTMLETKASIYQSAAAYYGKHGKVNTSIRYLDWAMSELTNAWHGFVRYLNDSRLIQILTPIQFLFSGCYAILRKHLDGTSAYERLLQFKALASLAGRERNRIIHSGNIDRTLLEKIQSLQNRIAELEAENIFRDTSDEYAQEERKLRELEKDFAVQFPENVEFTEVTWDKVQKAIPNHSVVIEYFFAAGDYGRMQSDPELTDEEILLLDIYVVGKQNGQCTLNRVSVRDGAGLLDKAHDFVSILQAVSDNSASVEEMSRLDDLRTDLYTALIRPVLSFLEDQDTIYIAPDNELLNLPFEILYDEEEVRLADHYKIIKIECARDFLFKSPGNPAPKGSLMIGNPSYDVKERDLGREEPDKSDLTRSVSMDLEGIKQLPFAELETKRIAERVDGKLVTGFEATKNLLLSAEDYENVHIATHGLFDLSNETDSLYSSCLLFAGVKNWMRTGKISEFYGNGIVTADEISRMDLRCVKMVVLSSCLSGMSEIFGNKGFHGMVGAMSAAGVHYVITHLWKANDFSTAILMDAFYYYYAEENDSPPVALAKAQDFLRTATVGKLKQLGWFDCTKQGGLDFESRKMVAAIENYDDRMRPFKNEAYWGGFACYRCN